MQEYLDDIMGQKEDEKLRKAFKRDQDKEFQPTGIQLPEKHEPCYNCAKCKKLYPLRNMNKKKKKYT